MPAFTPPKLIDKSFHKRKRDLGLLYANENFPLAIVKHLRSLGHDVLTSLEAGRANQRVPDQEVLAFTPSQSRILLTLNRRDFLKIHYGSRIPHFGIIVCNSDPDFESLAFRIHQSISASTPSPPFVIRINKPD